MNGVVSIVPKIDLSGFDHHIVDGKIRLRDGLLETPVVPGGERSRLDPRPPSTPAMTQDAIRADQRQLQGVWRVTGGTVGGRGGTADGKVRWTLQGDRIVVDSSGCWSGKVTLDPSCSPKRINLAVTSPNGTPAEVVRGIYEVRGDTLCVCLASGDEPRPENLRSGANQISLVLQRER